MPDVLERETQTAQEVVPGAVRHRVTTHILRLGKFTVRDLAELTGCNVPSIHSVIQRLVEEKFIIKGVAEKPKDSAGPGAPPRLYSLTTDPNKIDALHAKVAEFSGAVASPSCDLLSTEYYQSARRSINWMLEMRLAPEVVARLGREAELNLSILQELATEADPVALLSIDFERARLDLARNNRLVAMGSFPHLADQFRQQGESEKEVECYEYLFWFGEISKNSPYDYLQYLQGKIRDFRLRPLSMIALSKLAGPPTTVSVPARPVALRVPGEIHAPVMPDIPVKSFASAPAHENPSASL